jgi:hypothetical protein
MKKVTELCLGVAVAGVVAGAGSTVACAVAYAEPPAPDSGSSSAASDASGTAGPAARTRSRVSTARAGALTAPKATGKSTPTASVRATVVARPSAAPRRSAAAVPATPAPAPVSVPLLPVPATPVGPVSSVTVSVSTVTGRTRSRTASVVAAAVQVADPPPTHVLLIGTDGTNLDKVLEDPTNVGFFNLMDESVTGATTIVGHTTISGPSWSTILTGAWDNKTGVINNIFNPKPYDSWPTVFNLLEQSNPAIDTAVVADWQYINDMAAAGGYAADTNIFVAQVNGNWADTDAVVTENTIDLINNASATDSSFIFSYQVQVDEAGHSFGGGSPEFAAAINNVSVNIQDIMDAVAARELATGEDWTVIVTTDHGHQQSVGFGHGFQSPNETSSFVIFDLEGDSANDGKQNLGYSNADITPTIVSLFGVPLRNDFDGVPLREKNLSIVAPVDLNRALTDAIGMYGYPNIGTDIALGVRTVVASVPYFLGIITNTITEQLQSIVDQQIFLISALAQGTQFVVQLTGDVLVAVTQAVARAVGYLTGAGTIPPSDPPLPAPPADSVWVPALSGAALV